MRDLIGPRYTPLDLRPDQRETINWLVDTPSALLVAGVGAGKTIMGLSAIVELGATRTLVVGTKLVAETVWHAEAARWTHTQHLDVVRVLGTPAQRLAALAGAGDVFVINYENIAWLADNCDLTGFDLVIWDEVSALKSISSGRFRRLRRWIPKLPRRIGLTATPASNTLENVFGICYACDGGERFGRAFTRWREEYFKQGYNEHVWTPRVGALEAVTLIMQDMTRVMGDYADLPRLDVIDVPVVLDSRVYKLDRQIARDGIVERDGIVVLAETQATRAGKRQQLAQGFLYGEEPGSVIDLHQEKLVALDPLIRRAAGPVVVGYTYTEDLVRLQRAYPHAVTLSGDVVEPWNRGEVPMLLVHPKSGAHGLNLQFGGHELVLYGLNWSLELMHQLIGRLCRSGQPSDVVRVWRLVAGGTIDDDLVTRLQVKDTRQARVVAGLDG
jgi:hypothetical protein